MRTPHSRRQGLEQRPHARPGGEDEVDAARLDRSGETGVQGAFVPPEFQHVAEDGDPPAARRGRQPAEDGERRGHGRRAGVVAVVDQLEAAAGDGDA